MIHVLHCAARRLVRRPTFFALTAGSLAIALGVTTAAFGFADAWLHPSLAFDAPERTATVIMWGGADVAHGGMDARERWQTFEHSPSTRANPVDVLRAV